MRLAAQEPGGPVNVPRFAKRMPKIKNEKLVHCAIIIYVLTQVRKPSVMRKMPKKKKKNAPVLRMCPSKTAAPGTAQLHKMVMTIIAQHQALVIKTLVIQYITLIDHNVLEEASILPSLMSRSLIFALIGTLAMPSVRGRPVLNQT